MSETPQTQAPGTEPSAADELASLLASDAQLSVPDETVELQSEAAHSPIDWFIVGPAAAIIVAVLAWGLGAPSSFADFAAGALDFIVTDFGWAFVLFSTVFVVFILIIAFSNFGSIKLGGAEEEPEFSTVSWISMMFAAGMGIGLMFYGASEPLSFYRDGVPTHSKHEVMPAMATAMFHWTLHPWAMYAIVGLAIAYSTFRIGRKQLLSQTFVPLIGEKLAGGWLGRIIDILAIFATVFGTACSLGLGALQIGAGLKASGLIDNPSQWVVVGIVLVLTLAFLLSAMSGVSKGIQYLSNTNMILAALLAIFVFVLGPTVSVLNLIPGSIGAYLAEFFEMASRTAETADATAGGFLAGWTIFYWAWWISWSPFVGMFVARISRGRSIREFCLTVLFVPAAVSTIWFAIFGGTAIHMERNGNSIWGDGSAQTQLFNLLHQLPGGFVAGIIAMILLATFFITSADSASTVMGSMSQSGRTDASPWLSAGWGVLTALIGLTLLLSGGNDALSNLQNVTIIAASPFLIILIALMPAIVKALRQDVIYLELREHQAFQRKLARERRLHREQMEIDRQKARFAKLRPGRRAPKTDAEGTSEHTSSPK